MKDSNELAIWSTVVFGLALFIGTFFVAWDATEEYRENIARPQSSQSDRASN